MHAAHPCGACEVDAAAREAGGGWLMDIRAATLRLGFEPIIWCRGKRDKCKPCRSTDEKSACLKSHFWALSLGGKP
eukprot:1158008-Pelagomonas_calceolata.AAC.13